MIYFCNNLIFFLVLFSLVSAKFYTTSDRVHFPENFVGSNLFGGGKFVKKCFSMEEVALLSARNKFEALLPNFTIFSNNLENDASVEEMLEYLYGTSELINAVSGDNVQYITQAAYYDVVGGYLHFYYLPFVKFSFYAGTLTYKSTLRVYSLITRCKQILNTNGNGWRQSTIKLLKMNYKIEPINIHSKGLDSGTTDIFKDPCGNLLLASDEDYTSEYTDHELIVSLPRIETVDNDSIISVWLPFKNKRNYILNSKSSAFVLTKYYVDVLRCYQFRNAISNPFNRRFQELLNEKILPFIYNEEFYPGFGAILRVWETLKRSGVVVRNTYKNYDVQSESNEFWDETANLVNENGRYAQANDNINHTDEAQTANETNIFLKMIDSIKNYENEWNQKQKTKYICLAIIITVIGLLIIILCIFIGREKRTKNINRSTLTRERKSSWKRLLKSLSRNSEKTKYKNDAEIDTNRDLRHNRNDDITSQTSENTSINQTGIVEKKAKSQLKTNTENQGISKARQQKLKCEALRDHDYSSSSSSNSTKSKKRRIYRKIREQLKQSRIDESIHVKPRSIYSKFASPSEPNKRYNHKLKTKTKVKSPKKIYITESSESEKEVNSSSWETLPSSKFVRNVEN